VPKDLLAKVAKDGNFRLTRVQRNLRLQ